MKVLRGAGLGKLLPLLEKESSEKIQLIGRFDGANILLRFIDAWENLALEIDSEILSRSNDSEWNRARYRHAIQRISETEIGLETLLQAAPERSRHLFLFPQFSAEVLKEEEAARLTEQAEKERLYWMTYTVQLLGRKSATGVLIMDRPTPEAKFFAIDLVWSWLRILNNIRVVRMALSLGTGLVSWEDADFDLRQVEDPSKLPLPEAVLSHGGFDMRSMMGGARSPEMWTSDLRKRREQTMPTIPHGLYTDENIKAVDSQIDATRDGYLAFPDYGKVFLEHYGHSFTGFVELVRTLLQLARNSDSTVYCDFSDSLLKTIKTTVARNPEGPGILETMVWKPRDSVSEFPIVRTSGHDMFQFGMVLASLGNRAKVVYDLAYNNDPKGKLFESRCRKILVDFGFDTMPRSVFIPSGFMPGKESTDIDVVARKGNLVLVLECKQEKFRIKVDYPSNRTTPTENDFRRYVNETYHRGLWVADRTNAEKIGDDELKALLSHLNTLFVAPLIVTTYPIGLPTQNREVGIITVAELEIFSRDLNESGVVLNRGKRSLNLKNCTWGGEESTIVLESPN